MGLQSCAELNGEYGTLLSYDAERQRWQVELSVGVKNVLVSNLNRTPCTPGKPEILEMPQKPQATPLRRHAAKRATSRKDTVGDSAMFSFDDHGAKETSSQDKTVGLTVLTCLKVLKTSWCYFDAFCRSVIYRTWQSQSVFAYPRRQKVLSCRGLYSACDWWWWVPVALAHQI